MMIQYKRNNMQTHRKGAFAYDYDTEIYPGAKSGRSMAAKSE
jgi:hypothetical protein